MQLFLKNSVKGTAAALGLLLVVWLFIPTTDFVTPDWTVLVTDTAGLPLEGARVTVFSEQYTLESTDREETKLSDKDGLVHFDQRRLSATSFRRGLGVIRNVLSQGAHASFGVHTNVAASKPGYGEPSKLDLFSQNERQARATGGPKQVSHLVLVKCPTGYSGFGCSFPVDPEKPILPLHSY